MLLPLVLCPMQLLVCDGHTTLRFPQDEVLARNVYKQLLSQLHSRRRAEVGEVRERLNELRRQAWMHEQALNRLYASLSLSLLPLAGRLQLTSWIDDVCCCSGSMNGRR